MAKHAFKILSIDGGGIRGIIPCTILCFIEGQVGNLSAHFDLMAGTSTGGIITLGLSAPNENRGNAFSAKDMLNLYMKNGKSIFKKRQDFFSKPFSSPIIQALIGKPYTNEPIEELLKKYFGKTTLNETLNDVLVTTYDLQNRKPFYFSSRLAKIDSKENIELKEVARATSAAPLYFEPSMFRYDANNRLSFIDGGVFANNPSILAYSEAKELWKNQPTKLFEPHVTPSNDDLPFYMLSIGTGNCPADFNVASVQKWRGYQWLKNGLIDVLMSSVSDSTDYTMHHLLPPYTDGALRYQRINIEIPESNKDMDNVSDKNINELRKLAEDYIQQNETHLLKICRTLKEN